ncbi:6040_t:CDS:2, partial [Entrophospora sp. SA101]
MSHGKPPHVFNEFVNVNKDFLINKNNFLAICKGCIVRKSFDWSFSEAVRSRISNTVPSIEKHLISSNGDVEDDTTIFNNNEVIPIHSNTP